MMAKIDLERVLSPEQDSEMTHTALHKRDNDETNGRESENDSSTSINQRLPSPLQSSRRPVETVNGVSDRTWGSAGPGVVLLAVFVGSLVFMAVIFCQFPEMEE